MPKQGWQEITVVPTGAVRLGRGPDGKWWIETAEPRVTIVLPEREARRLHALMDQEPALAGDAA